MERLWLRGYAVWRAAVRRIGQVGNSLDRAARRERDHLARESGALARVPGWLHERLLALVRSRWLVVYWVAVVFAPIHVPSGVDEHLLEQLWGVMAAALALSLALQVFALERFSGVREAVHPQALLDFARETGLLGVFMTGVGSLLVIGVVLLPGGVEPGGWAGAYAVALSLGALALLALLFPEVLTAADPARRRRRRLARIRDGVQAGIDRQVLERIALNYLQQHVPAGVTLELFLPRPPQPGETRLSSDRRGEIVDIDLGLLNALAEHTAGGTIQLHARLGQAVAQKSKLVTLPAELSARDRERAGRLFIVRSAADPLEAQRRRLKVEASVVIRSADIDAHEEIRESYEELLLAVPRGWQRYRQNYAGNIAAAVDPLRLSVGQELISELWQFVTETAKAHDGEIGRDAVYLQLRIASGALELDADALLQSIAELQVQVYAALRTEARSETRAHGARALTQLAEFAKYFLGVVVDDAEESSLEERLTAVGRLRAIYLELGDGLKECVDARDEATADELIREWSEIRRRGRARYDDDGDDEGLAGAPAGGAAAQAELAAKLRSQARELDQRERLALFGAAMWAVRRMRRATRPEDYRAVLDVVSGRLGSVDALLARAGDVRALPHEDAQTDRWGRWILHDLGAGVHSIAPDLEALHGALVLALRGIDPNAPPVLTPRAWLVQRKEALERDLPALATDPAVCYLVPADQIAPRLAALTTAIKNAIAKQEALDLVAIANTALDPARKTALAANVRTAWRESRILPSLFRRADNAVLTTPEGEGAKAIVERVQIQRDLLQGGEIAGADTLGTSIGQALALREFGTLAALLRAAVPLTEATGDPRGAVDAAIDELSASGSVPRLMISPIDWRLERALDIRDITGPSPSLPDWWGFPPGAAHWYRGRYRDLLLFAHPGMPKREMIIVDLAKVGTWRDVVAQGTEPPVLEYEEPAAAEGQMPVVNLTVTQSYRFALAQPNAARRVVLPAAEET